MRISDINLSSGSEPADAVLFYLVISERAWTVRSNANANNGRDWKLQNPDYDRLYQRARKVLHNNAKGKCSPQAAEARYDFYGGHCAYCREPLPPLGEKPRTWHWDHVIPLSRGGSNWPSNLRPACAACNRAKGAKSLAAA